MKTFGRMIGTIGVCLLIMLALSTFSQVTHVNSQGDEGDVCSAILGSALQDVGSNCAEIGANEACYGHSSVSGELNSPRDFSTSGDRMGTRVIQSLQTQPADLETGDWGVAVMLMHVGDDVPLTLMLLGDTKVENARAIGADGQTCEVVNEGPSTVNVRRIPSTDGDIIGVLGIDSATIATGQNSEGDWLFIEEDMISGWVYAPLLALNCDIERLPAVSTTGLASTAPLQSLVLESHPNASCETLPDGLLIRSPISGQAEVVVNGVGFVVSGVGFITAQASDTMVVRGLEGQIVVTADGITETILSGMYATIPMDENLQVSGPASAPETIDPVLERDFSALEDTIAVLNAQDIGVQACMVTVDVNAILRGGPGTVYERTGTLRPPDNVTVSGMITSQDGYVWWQLSDGNWVREDVVTLVGNCTNVPTVASIPPTPTPGASSSDTGAGTEGRIRRALNLNGDACQTSSVSVGTLVTVAFGTGFASEAEADAAFANSTSSITANGVTLEVIRRRNFCPASDCPPNGRHGYNTLAYWIPMEPSVYTVVGQDGLGHSYSCVITVYER